MTKVELLMAICETPGWNPAGSSSSESTALDQLVGEGYVVPRLDGYEATALALEHYPNFFVDPDGKIGWRQKVDKLTPPPSDRIVVASIFFGGRGYEVELDTKIHRYQTRYVEPGAVRPGLNHIDSIRLMAEIARILPAEATR